MSCKTHKISTNIIINCTHTFIVITITFPSSQAKTTTMKLTVNVTLFSFIAASKTVTCQATVMIDTTAAKEAKILSCPAPVIQAH